ncbi:MAG: STAS domain-containing protein [Clostridia bacterium]|nr:STAS domain-containing protein [Clostridia bacterium]
MFNAYRNNDNNTITIEGRIDSVNASGAEEMINGLLPEGGEAVLDAQKLEYISSAGLRVLLRLKKSGPPLLDNQRCSRGLRNI